jgi:superfamily I DNA/RNA helicase
MSVRWSTEQQAVFHFVTLGRGSAVVEAVAGAGKTTTLVEAVRRMSGSVFLGAYNKKMGDELKHRVADLRNVKASTFHAAGYGALRSILPRDHKIEGKKLRNIAAEVVHNTRFAGYEPAVEALASMAKQRGFYIKTLVPAPVRDEWYDLINRYDIMDKLPEEASVEDLIDLTVRTLQLSNEDLRTIDFDDMIYLCLLRGARVFQNDWVLIDEAQDTNATRRELAARMLKRGGRLIAVGDPRQAIFGFTGADGDSLDLIKQQFGAQTLKLGTTYRCPKAVVAAAREYVDHITPAPTAPEGEHLKMTLREATLLVAPGDAILCRYNKDLVDLCFKLIREGKPAKIEGRAIGENLAALAGRWKVSTLHALETKLTRYEEREVAKAQAKDDEAKVERIQDQCATLRVLMERGAEQGITTVDGLKAMIKSMFDDVGASPRLIVLSSVHRSKGLEWPRVFVLGRRQYMPSRRAKQAWQQTQELNLCYVALTRSQNVLVDVDLPTSEQNAIKQVPKAA